jgi:hypothetical protein
VELKREKAYTEQLTCVSMFFASPLGLDACRAVEEQAAPALHRALACVWSNSRDRLHLLARDAIAAPSVAAVEVRRTRIPVGVLDRPLFIIAAPRSGSSLLYELLAAADELWTVGGESHLVIEGIPQLATAARGFASDRLTASDATPDVIAALHGGFVAELRDREGRRLLDLSPPPSSVRLLEKTPKNSLRLPLLEAAFPDARYLLLFRDPAENVASIVEAWESERFVSRPSLPGWSGRPWSLLLPPGWRHLDGRPLEEIAAAQWDAANRAALDDLAEVDRDRVCVVGYHELVESPAATLERLCRFAGVAVGERLGALARGPLPHSGSTVSPPARDKWRAREAAITRVLPSLVETHARLVAMRAP